MKLKAIRFGVLAILVSFVVSVEGNALACLSPFTMNYENTLMTCNSSMPPVKDGQVHHFNSSFHFLVLKDLPPVSALFMAPTGIQFEQSSVPGFSSEDHPPHLKYSSVPLYTFHHSFLI
jgi:hypothetical protein